MDLKRVDEIYEQIGKYTVDLPTDGWALGPKYIHDMISLTRGYINAVTFLLQEILQERQTLDRSKHAAKALFEMEQSRLLAEDDRVRRMPNIVDRQGQLNLILRENVQEIQNLEGQLLDLSYVEKAVKHRHNELKATMSDIRAQRALIRDAIDSGSYYGDESGTSRGSTTGPSQSSSNGGFSEADLDRDMAELDDLLTTGTLEAPSAEVPAAAPPVESEPSTTVVEPQITAPIKVAPVAASQEEEDFTDLISGVEDVPVPTPVVGPTASVEDPDLARFLDGEDLSDDLLQSV